MDTLLRLSLLFVIDMYNDNIYFEATPPTYELVKRGHSGVTVFPRHQDDSAGCFSLLPVSGVRMRTGQAHPFSSDLRQPSVYVRGHQRFSMWLPAVL